jgi:hypothetical protein
VEVVVVVAAKLEDLVGEEVPTIFMYFERWKGSKSEKSWI